MDVYNPEKIKFIKNDINKKKSIKAKYNEKLLRQASKKDVSSEEPTAGGKKNLLCLPLF